MDCLHKVAAFVILDADGRRMFGKYYDDVSSGAASKWPTREAQALLERAVHGKVRNALAAQTNDGDVLLHEGNTIVYMVDPELTYFIVGPADENELVLSVALSCVYESMQGLQKTTQALDKRTLLEEYDALLLVVDEIIDDGVVLETNPQNVMPEVQPYVQPENQAADGAKKALLSVNRFLKQNL